MRTMRVCHHDRAGGAIRRPLARRTLVMAVACAWIAVAACGGGASSSQSTAASDSSDAAIGGTAPDSGPVAWPAPPPDQVAPLADAAGLQLENKESLLHHVHAHVDVFIDGEHRTVPAGIGIVITDPAVHTGTADGQPAYGGIQGCDQPCISPLHTHDITGIVHTESATDVDNTLGQFFQEWSVRFDGTCVGEFCTPTTPIVVYVNGQPQPLQGAASVPLGDHVEIAVIIGAPPSRIPDSADFSKA